MTIAAILLGALILAVLIGGLAIRPGATVVGILVGIVLGAIVAALFGYVPGWIPFVMVVGGAIAAVAFLVPRVGIFASRFPQRDEVSGTYRGNFTLDSSGIFGTHEYALPEGTSTEGLPNDWEFERLVDKQPLVRSPYKETFTLPRLPLVQESYLWVKTVSLPSADVVAGEGSTLSMTCPSNAIRWTSPAGTKESAGSGQDRWTVPVLGGYERRSTVAFAVANPLARRAFVRPFLDFGLDRVPGWLVGTVMTALVAFLTAAISKQLGLA